MYCFDTNIILEIFKGNKLIERRLSSIIKSEVYITPISLCEIYRGIFLSKNIDDEVSLINDFLESVNLLNLDVRSCELYGKLYSELKRVGKLTQDFDLAIAAICIANNKILITKNKKHFKNIKGLKIEEW